MTDEHAKRPSGDRPAFTHAHVGVLAYVPDRWSRLWQPRHHVLARLARRFPVVWVEPPHEWREIPERLRGGSPDGDPPAPPGLQRHRTPWWLPKLYRPDAAAAWTRRRRADRAARAMRRQGVEKIVLYLWRPDFADALDLVPHDLAVYHIDDEYTFSESDVPIPEEELEVIRRSDMVFVHSPGLMEKKGGINPDTVYVPNGVDYELYARQHPEPDDLREVPRPRIGYTGYLKRELDWPLLVHLAEAHADRHLVLVGPLKDHPGIRPHVEELRGRGNVHFLGAKTVEELAAYPAHFDVCLMPYRRTAYTDLIFPLKLHEYLASGTPVVGTPIRTLAEFSRVVRLADSPEAWSREVAAALDADGDASDDARRERRAVARRHDWDRLTDLVAGSFLRGLGRESEGEAILPEDPSTLGASATVGEAT